ncbi:MAG: DNA-processing protein DprA [Puniceicoccales bacterium]|jgi:DNA processing protein|nr:DNA-processing protein DprA [Puniceicoccales bacterium]
MLLNALPNIGPCTVQKLLAHFNGDVRRILSVTADQLSGIPRVDERIIDGLLNPRKYFRIEEEEAKLAALRGRFLSIASDNYPILLKEIPDAPIGVYTIGEIDNSVKNIAIVGTRTTTLYGLETARMLAMELVKRGFCIVSGMARGIDTAAHEGALAGGGKTIAVFGNGIDIIYPQENAVLYKKISENGAIISEFVMGRHADRQTFPIRNRLIAGLCHAVIIIESDRTGGSMITAKFAAEYGRHVFAIPGRIDQPSSAGCLALIKEGASMLTCVDDIFEELPYLSNSPKQATFPLDTASQEAGCRKFQKCSTPQQQPPEFSCPIEEKVYEILLREKSATMDAVITISGLPTNKVLHSLQMLEIRGFAYKRYDGMFEIKTC